MKIKKKFGVWETTIRLKIQNISKKKWRLGESCAAILHPTQTRSVSRTDASRLPIVTRDTAAEGAEHTANGGGTYLLDLYIDMQVVF